MLCCRFVKLSVLTVVIMAAMAYSGQANDDLQSGMQAYNQGRYKDALQLLEQSLRLGKTAESRATALYYMGLCQQRLNDLKGAESSYRSSYQLQPAGELGQYSLQALQNVTGHGSSRHSSSSNVAVTRGAVAPTVSSGDDLKNVPNQIKIPFIRGSSRHIFVDGYINGKAARIMFDTGAEQCFASAELLRELNIAIPANAQKIRISGSVGDVGGLVAPMTVSVGPISRVVPVLIAPGGVEPLLGQSWFRGFDYQIDNPGGFIRFTKKGTSQSLPSDVLKVPFRKMGNNLLVNITVNGKQLPMIFDTGANTISMGELQAAYLGISIPADAPRGMSSGIGGTRESAMVYVDRMQLGPITKAHVPVWVSAGDRMPLLGQEFFRDRPFTIDYDENVIKFLP